MKSIRKIIGWFVCLFFCIGFILVVLLWTGVLQCNGIAARKYAVHGVDVSEYQGEIDWETLSGEDITFAFIKATEGSSYVDPRFSYNWENAAKTELRIGAYHFFSFDSSGDTQAENFIQTVPSVQDMLPPVVDVEYYGSYRKNAPDREKTIQELTLLLQSLEDAYQIQPILYITHDTAWLAQVFPTYAYWIRDVYSSPSDAYPAWTFWQYSNRLRLEGYDGEERFIDGNVYIGSEADFAAFGQTN